MSFTVEDMTKGQNFDHRLMDFNNLPTTTFADVKRALTITIDRVAARVPKRQ